MTRPTGIRRRFVDVTAKIDENLPIQRPPAPEPRLFSEACSPLGPPDELQTDGKQDRLEEDAQGCACSHRSHLGHEALDLG
ncbi:MAG TPA: hypothetical protein VGB18_08755, partial [Candidatus Thermoplasmatota archaeon]